MTADLISSADIPIAIETGIRSGKIGLASVVLMKTSSPKLYGLQINKNLSLDFIKNESMNQHPIANVSPSHSKIDLNLMVTYF